MTVTTANYSVVKNSKVKCKETRSTQGGGGGGADPKTISTNLLERQNTLPFLVYQNSSHFFGKKCMYCGILSW